MQRRRRGDRRRSSPSSTASTRASTATGACAASSTASIFGDDLYEAMRKVKALFDPHGRLNPGVMVDAPPMTEDLRDPALPPAAAARDPAVLRRARRHARRGRPLPAHRRLPQDRQRRDVPLLHGHARGGARDARARERARQGALLARPEGRAGRRAPARDPRPLPRVQGVQERVPAERRHGDDEERVPLPLPGRPRRPAALAAVRRDPARSTGSAPRPRRSRTCPRACPPLRALLERTAGHRPPAPAAALRARDARALAPHARAARSRATRGERRVPRRLLHHLHRAGVGRAAIELLEAAGWRVRLESGGCCGRASISKGLLDQARGMAADGRPAGAGGRARRADRRLRAVLPAHAPRGAPRACCPATRARRRWRARRGSSTSCWSRRSTTARCASTRPRRSAGGGSSSTATATRRRSPAPRRPSRCCERIPGARGGRARRRLLRDGRLVRVRGRALRPVDADRRVAPVPGAAGSGRRGRWSPRPACPAASRSRTASGGGRAIPSSWSRGGAAGNQLGGGCPTSFCPSSS